MAENRGVPDSEGGMPGLSCGVPGSEDVMDVPSRRIPDSEETAPLPSSGYPASFSEIFFVEASVLAVLAALSSLAALPCAGSPALDAVMAILATLLAATVMVLRGWGTRREVFFHTAYVMGHALLLRPVYAPPFQPLAHPPVYPALEWWTVPFGAWLLFWGTVGARSEDRPSYEHFGTAAILIPSVLMSALEPSAGMHVVLVFVAGLLCVLGGAGGGRVVISTVGGVGLILEVMLQIHMALISRPWPIYASVAGVCLIGAGILVERSRARVVALGQSITREFSARPAGGTVPPGAEGFAGETAHAQPEGPSGESGPSGGTCE